MSIGTVPQTSAGLALTSFGIPSRTLERSDPLVEKISRRKLKRSATTKVPVSKMFTLLGIHYIHITFTFLSYNADLLFNRCHG